MFRSVGTFYVSKNLFLRSLKDQAVSKEKRREYMQSGSKGGRQFEGFICSVLREMDEVEEVIHVPCGTVADTTLKVDIGYVLKGDDYVHGLQVKSTSEQADKHLSLGTVSYQGTLYPVPGVVYREGDESDWSVVCKLMEGLGLTLKKDLSDALSLAKRAGWTQVQADLSVVNRVIAPAVVTRLKGLGACTIQCTGGTTYIRFVG